MHNSDGKTAISTEGEVLKIGSVLFGEDVAESGIFMNTE